MTTLRLIEDLARIAPALAAAVDEQRAVLGADVGSTVVLGAVGRRFVEVHGNLTSEQRTAFFEAIEAALAGDDRELSDAASTGLLESLANSGLRGSHGSDILEGLGPLGRCYLHAWAQFHDEGPRDDG